MQTASGYDAVALFKVADHFTMFFGLFLLGPDEQEIEYYKHQDDGDKRCKSTGSLSCPHSALTHCIGSTYQDKTPFK
jgi:hypothetical protein